MTPLTQEWVDKAEGDFLTATRELRARKSPNYDTVCFHAQQSAEKYLKARLKEENVPFGKTHNLADLLDAATYRACMGDHAHRPPSSHTLRRRGPLP
jgi:HEPN domain-containing protein